jgi:uncharacterized protein DUF6875
MEGTASAESTRLFRLEDLDDASRADMIEKGDLDALHAVADWIKTFIARPNKDLGRAGPVCPFVPGALDRRTLWLAPERIANRSLQDVVDLIEGYRKLFLDARPNDGADVDYKVIVVVFTDLSTDHAQGVFDDVLEHVAASSYENDGTVFGPFYESNEGTAIYNPSFRPFRSPVPFLFVRQGVVSDWKFFLDDDDWLDRWASRYGKAGAEALAEELRDLPWHAKRD